MTRLLRSLSPSLSPSFSSFSSFSSFATTTTTTTTPPPPKLFDLHAKSLQKARAALSPAASSFDYLRDEVATRLVDRLHDIPRPFPHAVDLFCGSGHVLRAIVAAGNPAQITSLVQADLHPAILQRAATAATSVTTPTLARPHLDFVFPHESAPMPLQPGSLDLVLSAGGLHWVNDLPLLLRRCRHLLRPDGLFLAAMCGGDSLHELRVSLQLAEDEVRARLAPRISPMVHLRDAAGLVSACGLVLTTVDVDRIVVPFASMAAVVKHLRGMGESNALVKRDGYCAGDVMRRAAEIYEQRFGFEREGVACVPATFEIIHMIGWAPAVGQPTPKDRGSATFSIADLPKAGAF